MRQLLFCLLACVFIASTARATTWDEPWHEEVLRISDSFIKVKIIENQGAKVKADVIKLLGGTPTPQQIELGGFSRLQILSTSSGSRELELPFRPGSVYYVFVKKSEKTNTYQIPTPTSGWAVIEDGVVYATYRHSYHQAIVPEDVYEKTMQAIFNGVKGRQYDVAFIQTLIKEQLTQSVAILKNEDPEMMKRFFLQHVAMETFYHLGKGADLSLLTPFMNTNSFHVQVSACRAASRIDSAASKELLLKFIEGKGPGFAKVMCVWGLKRLNAREMAPRLEAYMKKGADEKTGFGGSIMDPRIGTFFPDSVWDAIKQLLSGWQKPRSK